MVFTCDAAADTSLAASTSLVAPGGQAPAPRSERRSSSLNKRGEGSGCSLALQFLAQSESLMADSMLGMQAIDMRLSDD